MLFKKKKEALQAEDDDEKTMSIYEIKASQNREWLDDASLQIMIYALCSGKTWYRLHLMNPFQNSKITYYFDTKKILTLRKLLTNDILIYNTNSFMAKMYPLTKINEKLEVSNTLFLNIIKDENKRIKQATIINMLSPIKCEIVYDKFTANNLEKCKGMDKEDRYASESEIDEKELIKELKDILESDINKNKTIYSYTNNCKNIKGVISIKKIFNIKDFDEIVEFLKYKEKEELNYSADINDSLIRNIFCLAFMFLKNRFV